VARLSHVASVAAFAAAASAFAAPPAYTPVRWNEDYSYLADSKEPADFFDPIKHIPLGPDGWYLSLGGQLRERYELWNNNNFDAGPQDGDGFYLHRLLFHADLHVGKNVRLFGQLKSSMIDSRFGGPRPTDSDEIDLQQAFVDFSVGDDPKESVYLRLGRQDLIYGAQRLISPLDWANVRRTFEGARVSWTSGNNTLDLFWVRPVIVENEEPNDGDNSTSFAGVYDVLSLPELIDNANSKLEIYFLALNRTSGAYPTEGAGDEDRYTIGTRFYTNPKPFDLDVELDYQFGNFISDDISAASIAIEGGFTAEGCPLKPRTFIGFDLATGDRDANDGKLNTFNQLFPLGHAYFGYIDTIGRQNIVDLHPGVDLTLLENASYAKKVTLRAEYHLFWRQNASDALYNAGGAPIRPAGGSDERFVGSEIDLLLNWQVDRHTLIYIGYSHFFPGDFLSDTGPSGDIDFIYAAAQFTF
jgi:hypothetical protein